MLLDKNKKKKVCSQMQLFYNAVDNVDNANNKMNIQVVKGKVHYQLSAIKLKSDFKLELICE